MSAAETGFSPPPDSQAKFLNEPTRILRDFVRLYLYQQRRLAHEAGMPARSRMLLLLCRHEPLTQSEFGRILGLEKSWVSRGVEQLVEEGWVARTADQADRRCMRLSVTDQGRMQAMELEKCFNQQTEAFLAKMSPENTQGLLSGLKELNGILESLRSSGGNTGETR